MRSEHAWALLTARAIQYGKTPGGYAHMTPADVAGLLRGLPRRPFLTAMLADCGDSMVHHELYVALRHYVFDRAVFDGWRLDRPRLCEQIALLAILELVGARDPCPACEGRGAVPIETGGPNMVRCEPCRGSGRAPLSGRDRAAMVQIHEVSWSRTWAERYEVVFGELHGWLMDARRHMARRLRAEARAEAEKPATCATAKKSA